MRALLRKWFKHPHMPSLLFSSSPLYDVASRGNVFIMYLCDISQTVQYRELLLSIHVYEFKSKNKSNLKVKINRSCTIYNIFLFLLGKITNVDVCQVQRRVSIARAVPSPLSCPRLSAYCGNRYVYIIFPGLWRTFEKSQHLPNLPASWACWEWKGS